MQLQRRECRSREIAALLKEDILRGEIPPGAPLASIRSLASSFEVSSQVIVSAFDLLEQDRLIQSQPRRGFRVADPLPGGRFLIVTYDAADDIKLFSHYLIPEFENLCRSRGIETEKLPVDMLRSVDPERFVKSLKDKSCSGIVLCGNSFIGREPEIRLLRHTGIPVVQPHADTADRDITKFAMIAKDQNQLWFEALSFLKSRGFRKIGAVGQFAGSEVFGEMGHAALRCRPIEQHFAFLRELELEIPEDPLLFINISKEKECEHKFSEWLENHRRFDAVVCYSDFYAVLLYAFCRKKNISIPEDLAVMSFGDYPGNELLSPPLTSINFMPEKVAEKCLELLLNSSEWYDAGELPFIASPFYIVERQSTHKISVKPMGSKNAEKQ